MNIYANRHVLLFLLCFVVIAVNSAIFSILPVVGLFLPLCSLILASWLQLSFRCESSSESHRSGC